ncbi:MAG: sulfite exporter TauE/SafE family protein [Methanomicrobia archaeon]|nr:sulfite exporter TauE/SafE family protein [Methanomicrobia archaeon]
MELITALTILALTGIAVGFGQGLFGVGGSFIMVPVMFWLFTALGIAPDVAIKLAFGSSLLVVFPTAISGAFAHTRKGAVWWKAGIILGVCGIIGALTGSTITTRFLSAELLKPVFGLVVGIGTLQMLAGRLPEVDENPEERALVWAGLGFAVGVFSGLLGIGGGLILVPVLVMGLKFKMHRAVGTSLAMIIFASFGGALGYLVNGLSVPNLPPFSLGYVNLLVGACLAITSIPVAQLGARTAHKLPATQLRYLFTAVMFYIALRMIGVFEWLGLPL